MKRCYLIIALLLIVFSSFGRGEFQFSSNIQKAYNKTLDLRFGEARTLVDKEKKINPNNLLILYIENYIDFLTVMIEQDFEKFQVFETKRAGRLKAIRDGNRLSPYYLYTEAEMRLQWGILRGLFDQYYGGIKDVKRAYKLLEANQRQFPKFRANKKSLGIIKIVFGNIPSSYQWVTNLFGLKGDAKQGERYIKELMTYAKSNKFHFEREVYIAYAYLLTHLGNSESASWKYIRHTSLDAQQSRLVLYIKCLIAFRTGNNDSVIAALENRSNSAAFHPIPQLEYFLAKAKLLKLDKGAKRHFQNYLKHPQGQHFVKASYHGLAWYELVNNNLSGYKMNTQKVRSRGTKVIYDDKKALEDVNEGKTPNITLLKARLLFDGGYYQQAERLLNSKQISNFGNQDLKLEYIYRKGRVADRQKKYKSAVQYYKKTLDYDVERRSYLTSKAILSVGMIYENQKNTTLATKYYKMSLSFNPKRYKFSLHQQAKAGLNRMNK